MLIRALDLNQGNRAGGELSRRRFLAKSSKVLFVSLLGNSALENVLAKQSNAKPNILYLLCDQWRGQAIGCAGDSNAITPNIDKLAGQGVRFSHCYTNQPLCTPHRAMLMSGKYPTRTGVYENNILLRPEENCIGDVFSKAGYGTGYVGKWHLDGGEKPGRVKHTQGWQYFSGFNRGHHYYDGEAVYWEKDKKHALGDGVYQPDDQTDRAMKWITKQTQKQRPWFMMLSWGAPHTPYRELPEKYLNMFDPDKFELRPNVKANKNWDIKQLRQELQGYYGHIKALDENAGRLMKFLEDNNLAENTIVMLTADHGDMLLSQSRLYKGVVWEESINVPFIARWPKGIPAGKTVDKLLAGIDLFPTLCGLCNVEVPDGKDGEDYSHLLRGESGPERGSVFITHGKDKWRAVRTKQYTYCWNFDQTNPALLYDNQRDPYQKENIAYQADARGITEKMHLLLFDWLIKVEDPLAAKLKKQMSV
jgi:arylsulfatase A-like enzyme